MAKMIENVPPNDVETIKMIFSKRTARNPITAPTTTMNTICPHCAEKRREKPYGKKELVWSVKQMVYHSDGKIRVEEMQERSGYSARYINKTFLEEMGFSPKTFCKIIQFQRSLEFLNYGAPDKMTDAAVALGYYDQAQFIHDFSRYAGITPKRYLKMVEELQYRSRIIQR